MRRPVRLLAVVSWLGGAVSLLPFAQEWFDLSQRRANVCLFLALVSAVALSFALVLVPPLARVVERLAGPPEPRARSLVLVAVVAPVGALAMLGLAAALG
ncbi:MAG: hypothetical protein NZL88_11480 [Gaiellaceae bacterium]|nr:hypothetical protein [Gaiellaceae bacterium]